MRFKTVFTAILVLGFTSSGIAYSPAKIIEVTDSFGNTYDVDSEFSSGETFARITNNEQEVIVSDETEITFCVTEVEHEEGREVKYYFSHFGHEDIGWQKDNCATFDGYSKEDWDANEWSFEIYVRDDADITARDYDVEGGYDFQFQPRYSNLVLPSESNKTTEKTVYDTIRVSKSKYQSLQEQANEVESKDTEISELQESLNEKNSTIEQLNNEIDQKESEIDELDEEINEKESTIEEMNSTINELEDRVEELEGGLLSGIMSIF